MKMVFKRTGGFAPSMIGCILDTERMPADEAQQLQALVKSADLFNQQTQEAKSARDVHYFNFQVENDEGVIHQVRFDTVTLPDAVRPLMEFCKQRSNSLLPDDV